jgi:nucleoside-diphosphate-sugar epimerase
MEAYWLTAKKGKIGEIYNISGHKIISIKNYLDALIKRSKVKIITKINPKLIRPVDIELQLPDSKKFRKDTGWTEKISFKDSIDKFINECRKIYY